jgi:hypothetical protein
VSKDSSVTTYEDLGPIRVKRVWREVTSSTSVTYHLLLEIGDKSVEVTSSRQASSVHVYLNGEEMLSERQLSAAS